jgi:hypothetical protein
MAIKIDNACETLIFTAPAGGVTAFTATFDATSRVLCVPCIDATSGATYPAWCNQYRANGIDCSSGYAYSAGEPVAWSTGNSQFEKITTGTTANIHAYAAEDIASGSTTGDFILSLPLAFVRP